MNTIKREPVAIWTSIGVLVGLAIQKYLIPDMSSETLQLLSGVLAVALPTIGGAFYARSKVFAPINSMGQEVVAVPKDNIGKLREA